MSEWCANAPELEEDVAMANIALDLLGQARALLTYAGMLEGQGRDEDDLAFMRSDGEFVNVHLVELPNGDFAYSMVKLLFFAAYQKLLYDRLSGVRDRSLADISAKAVKESAYHFDHAAAWVERLGDGTRESHRRTQDAVDAVWPYTHDLFSSNSVSAQAEADSTGVDPRTLRPIWEELIRRPLESGTLSIPCDTWSPDGGRKGIHTEAFGVLLAEMQAVHRAHPGATW
jgi:ring-1,2-phenylacetyl-CoA epoxidase subunit PaaC